MLFLDVTQEINVLIRISVGSRDKEEKVKEIKRIFEESLMHMDCIWLLANSIYERTFVGIKI